MTGSTEPKKSLGQHWLYDKPALNSIINSADIKPDDVVLEIGPGTGSLTTLLTYKAAQVIAVEYDSELTSQLKTTVVAKNLTIVNDDIRQFDLTKLPKNYKIVANIPYYLTAYLLRLLTETANQPVVASLLVQKEVAERVAAKPGRMSFISVAVQLNYDVELGQIVPAKLFSPPPKVNSQILILRSRGKKLFYDLNYQKFLKFVKIGFSNPRKTLANNLSVITDKIGAETALSLVELSASVRAQELSLDQWAGLYNQLKTEV